MRRGVTSTLIYTLPQDVLVSEVIAARITVRQGQLKAVERSLSEMEIDASENTLGFQLTQEEALRLSSYRTAEVQLKIRLIGGNVLATSICQVPVCDILNEEVI